MVVEQPLCFFFSGRRSGKTCHCLLVVVVGGQGLKVRMGNRLPSRNGDVKRIHVF